MDIKLEAISDFQRISHSKQDAGEKFCVQHAHVEPGKFGDTKEMARGNIQKFRFAVHA